MTQGLFFAFSAVAATFGVVMAILGFLDNNLPQVLSISFGSFLIAVALGLLALAFHE